jgi:hypothetical protein
MTKLLSIVRLQYRGNIAPNVLVPSSAIIFVPLVINDIFRLQGINILLYTYIINYTRSFL